LASLVQSSRGRVRLALPYLDDAVLLEREANLRRVVHRVEEAEQRPCAGRQERIDENGHPVIAGGERPRTVRHDITGPNAGEAAHATVERKGLTRIKAARNAIGREIAAVVMPEELVRAP
jgi:hypothetical protein